MKVFSSAPDGNEAADLAPARYFNLAIKQILEIEEWMRTAKQAAQPLLVHIDAFVYFSKKYPDMAKRRIRKIDIDQVKTTFDDWYERCSSKIPAEFRDGIRENADELFSELQNIAN
ncbi:hypothetical protein [uncultured Aquimarina sp.]|uniref:hypothetical protein n=1 Tax=uncultured Aquimarina sp. TaxID=575652 RepID=UPI0026100877|nr:hypothetical protein [uncultured Aquimarina sp.]